MEVATKTYDIYFDSEVNSVIMEWEGYSTSSEFREGTELMLNTLLKNNTYKVLADISGMALIGMEDQQWLEKDFLPKAISFGFQTIAIIKPDYYFNKVAVESISFKVDQHKLQINYFETIGEAREWLMRV